MTLSPEGPHPGPRGFLGPSPRLPRRSMTDLVAWPLPHLFWLVPLLFALHNAEEAPRMATWVRTTEPAFMPPVTTPQFTIAVSLLTVLVLILTVLAVRLLPLRLGVPLITGLQAIIGINALIHVGATLWYRRYHPGVVTAVLLNLPFTGVLFRYVLATPYVSGRDLLIALVLAPLLMVALARGALYAGAALAPQ